MRTYLEESNDDWHRFIESGGAFDFWNDPAEDIYTEADGEAVGEAVMSDDELLKRITTNPEIFGGKPIIRGMRISVELILSLLAQGETIEGLLADYPELEPEDIRACTAYTHDQTRETDPGQARG